MGHIGGFVPMDNNEKNSYVKRQITQALVQLLRKHELRDISVSEICSKAQVSRNSFYRNFESKEQVIRAHIMLLSHVWDERPNRTEPSTEQEALADIFSQLTYHSDFYQLLWKRGLLYLLRDTLFEVMGPKPDYSNHIAYTLAFIISGIYGWIEEWFRRGMQESGEEMARLLAEQAK